MSRSLRRRRNPALLRARFRTLFFLLTVALALALGHRAAVAPAVAGALAGLYSIRVAQTRGAELVHTFVIVDWLLLGCVLALSGGAESWLLGTIPVLAMGQLAGAPRSEWPFLLGPALLLVVVLAIADPSLGGSRAGGIAKIGVLVGGGWVAATRLSRRPPRRTHAPKVDVSTGLSTGACLSPFLESRMATALAEHRPLSLVYVRLEYYKDSRDFLGAQGSEELVRSVARRAERRLSADGRAFRIGPDSLILVLPDCALSEARDKAEELAREVSTSLIAGRRQTLVTGAASFPTVRRLEDLLGAARDDALREPDPVQAIRPALPLTAAQ